MNADHAVANRVNPATATDFLPVDLFLEREDCTGWCRGERSHQPAPGICGWHRGPMTFNSAMNIRR